MNGLSEAEIRTYRDDGVLFPFPVLSDAELAAALAVVDRIDTFPAEQRAGLLLARTHWVSKTLCDLCRNPRILDRVEGLIGPNILVWGANFFLKEPRSPAYVGWHQDATYWGLEPADIVTAWVALTPSTVESGCMRVAPGTHRGGIVDHVETWQPDNLLSRGQEIAVEVDQDTVVDVVLRPGEMSLHHVKIAHNSEPNRASHRRIGFAIRYVAAHVRQGSGARDLAMQVRGEDRWNYFEHDEGAKGEFLPEDVARHAEAWAAGRRALAKQAG
ncbi:phytanoyl-CoA dioxygenase family protein [Alsobacter sp. SYSU M60028]|uniref:Phytanoyl-CoA dioxygenase family protein n=1 Tax=Alsobacter ponti TaxID=2962936 RepID=A0ABT1LAD6_9HYPH|nr:phytanoyl-CoA dioxygenase family protein [Alsobacter ponti]MCP8938459.1 phytanoyl-CoA dioxygenase family protein [Alsobacter ponti]